MKRIFFPRTKIQRGRSCYSPELFSEFQFSILKWDEIRGRDAKISTKIRDLKPSGFETNAKISSPVITRINEKNRYVKGIIEEGRKHARIKVHLKKKSAIVHLTNVTAHLYGKNRAIDRFFSSFYVELYVDER